MFSVFVDIPLQSVLRQFRNIVVEMLCLVLFKKPDGLIIGTEKMLAAICFFPELDEKPQHIPIDVII